MISKKDFKRFNDAFESAFDDLVTAIKSIENKPFKFPLYELTGEEASKGIMVTCRVTYYCLESFTAEVGFRDPLNDNTIDRKYITFNEIATEGEW
ncbi:hypothetical protein BCB4_0195 [Bacillus phage B4]|uniref:Uncharacterized protein n=2 Tax=Bequatrovirus B4 TaxID=1918005 RepID=J9PRI0_9CAUD|nr:hypothetical protein BCB4_0195 [Bacillus phage B4]YP_009783786.1 hypothetical protein QLX26_gp190 [Bacillus phage B5S]MEB9013777.1 hypothetical protein [Bacillus cereus]AEW47424.1 hypothetical protein B5S_0190 [Bacillus phage B5S]AEZ65988.1 hypothetical protein BCB4_0195 [Bacillus phage B4]MEB9190608.1 hypothetical protein [Bacillus cereus]